MLCAGKAFPQVDSTPPAHLGAQPSEIESNPDYQPIAGKQRLKWVVKGTVGPESLGKGLFLAGIATAQNRPPEYGPHWEGFGKRYGMRLTGVATDHVMEASVGALWGEDPRYFHSLDHDFRSRMKHAVFSTFTAPRADGHMAPAYARFIAIPGSNLLSNTWRPERTDTASDAGKRIVLAFAGRVAGNVFKEFWPDIKRRISRKK